MNVSVVQVTGQVKMISLGGIDSNMFLIGGQTLVDATTGIHRKLIDIAFKKAHISKECIKSVILTHEHFDHLGGVWLFPNAKILAHARTAEVLEKQDNSASYARYFGGHVFKRKVDVRLKDADIIRIGDTKLETIYAPGHSEGSICLLDAANRLLVSGDLVFKDATGRTDLAGGDETQLKNSLGRLKGIDIEMILPGHGPIISKDGSKHIKNLLGNLKYYDKKIS